MAQSNQAHQPNTADTSLEARVAELEGQLAASLAREAELREVIARLDASDQLHRLREDLEASQAMLQLVIDNLPQAVFWKDQASHFLGCNRRFLEDAGFGSAAEVMGKSDAEMPWAEFAVTYQADDQAVMAGGPRLGYEEQLTRGDGRTIWLSTSKLPLRRDNAVIGILAMYEDITARKQAEEQLRTFQALVEGAPDGIVIAALDGAITYANDAFETMFSSTATVVGRSLESLVAPEHRPALPDLVAEVRHEGAARGQIQYQRDDGFTFAAQYSALLVRRADGQPLAFASINRDVTEQLRAEQTLRASEQRSSALLAAIPDLMFLIDEGGTIIDYRAEQTSDLALLPEAFLNRRFAEVLPPALAELVQGYVDTLRQSRLPQTFEYQIAVNGELRDYEARMALSNADVLMLAREISERRRAEQERQALQEQVIAIQDAALRELSTPLMPIANGVVVMPIIGSVDSSRAQQVMETLLEGIAGHNAEIAILDITGVKVVDTQVAGALIRAAQAARMLGAEVVLTGISPEIAQTLVHIGAEMGEITAKRSLQQGITYALGKNRSGW